MIADLEISAILSPLDWVVFLAVLLLTLGTVVWGSVRRSRIEKGEAEDASMLDLLLMGRRLTLPLFTATLVATWYGGIFGVSEHTFTSGIYNWLTQGIFWYAAYLIFALLLVNKVRGTRARTMPELLETMFGPDSAKLGACFNLLNVMPLTYIIGIGILLQAVFGGNPVWWMVGGTVLVVSYSTSGGLRSVVYSDVIQFVVMCSAVLLVIVFSMTQVGSLSWLRSVEHIPGTHWELGGGMPLSATLIWGFIALGTLVDPNFYQRCLAARDEKTARNGILAATAIWVVFDFCTTFGTLYALAKIPEAEPKMAYLLYSVQLLPAGLKGFFLAGMLATILSTLDSYLFIAGTAVAYDLAPASHKGSVRWHHVGSILVAAVALILAIVYHRETLLVDIWKTIGGYTTACLLLPLMTGYLFKMTDRAFVRAALLGALGLTAWSWWGSRIESGFPAFYAGLACSILGLCVGAVRGEVRTRKGRHPA